MKTLKKFFISLLTVMMFVTVYPVITNSNNTIGITEVHAATKLNKKSATIVKGKTLTLKVTGTKKRIKWTTSNKKIATVTSKGKVTAKKKGTCTITAKVGSKKYKCKITVKNPTTSLNKSSLTMQVGDTYTLKAKSTGVSKKVTWKSSNKSVATINSKGLVTAKKIGTTKITATMNGISKTITVKVNKENVVGNYKFTYAMADGMKVTKAQMKEIAGVDISIYMQVNANKTFKMTASINGQKESTNGKWTNNKNAYTFTITETGEKLVMNYSSKKLTYYDPEDGSQLIFQKYIP